ncbi:MAG: polysaccharide biosynthesis/export family protein [Thermodesulfovibrionia bacterium]|nr:polysaccharide biosynthesis/export family protein [Thermodesulfovibrionia bacterium]
MTKTDITSKIIIIILFFFSFTACLTVPLMASETELKEQPSDVAEEYSALYKAVPDDVLTIKVYENPDLSGAFTISQDGNIVFPLLGLIKVSGLSAGEIERLLTEMLGKDYLYDPIVSVTATIKSQLVYVVGEVKKPGTFPYKSGMTVLKAITLADGATLKASTRNTVIKRIINNKEVKINVDMSDTLQPDDIVEVPLSFW